MRYNATIPPPPAPSPGVAICERPECRAPLSGKAIRFCSPRCRSAWHKAERLAEVVWLRQRVRELEGLLREAGVEVGAETPGV